MPQLLNEIETNEVPRYVTSDDWWLQEKHNGERAMIEVRAHHATGINRSGLRKPLPTAIAKAAAQLDDCILDGEKVGDEFWAFDCLEHKGMDLRPLPLSERDAILKLKIGMGFLRGSPAIHLVKSFTTTQQKCAAVEQLTRDNAEGFVLKRHDARYTPDRPGRYGTWLKYKYWASASCIVIGPNGDKSSARIMVLKDGKPVEVGAVTIHGNKVFPKKGEIIEVRYLYCGPGGRLVQPTYEAKRDDVRPQDCTWKQLKHMRPH